MNISQVKRSLERKVLYNGLECTLKACVIRKDVVTGQFYYQAEIKDLKASSALLYCSLEDLEEIKQ